MPLPEKRDHAITLPDAVELARQHRKDHPNEPKAHFFFRDAFDTLLKQPGAAGIRIYRGKGKAGTNHLMMVAVDGSGEDMTASGTVMDYCIPCPPYCAPASPLQA
jgi:hypothetical protein